MKKNLFVVILASFVVFGCTNSTSESNSSNEGAKNELLRSSKCPEGSSEVWSFDVQGFNFKRPKYGCLSGFSFCIKGEWTFEGCKDNSTGQLYPANPALTERGTHVVAIPTSSNVLVLLFPKNLMNMPGNVPGEFGVFSVDEELMVGDMKLVKGNYKTEIKEDLIIVKVPFE